MHDFISEREYYDVPIQIEGKELVVMLDSSLFGGQQSSSHRTHMHPPPYYELLLFQNVSGGILSDREVISVRHGDVAVVAPGFSHRLELSDADRREDSFCFTFMLRLGDNTPSGSAGQMIERFFSQMQAVRLIHGAEAYFGDIGRIAEEYEARRLFFHQFIKNHLENFLTSILRLAFSSEALPAAPRTDSEEHRMQRIEGLLELAVTKNMTCEEMGERLHLSVRQVQRLIQKLYGKSYRTLVYEMRMDYAAELLIKNTMSLIDIADLLGYKSVSAFHYAYRRHFGETPRRHQRRLICGDEPDCDAEENETGGNEL